MEQSQRQSGDEACEFDSGGVLRALVPLAEEAPFFIVGSGRSGTTLLRMMLIGHSRIEIPPETWYILPLVRQFPLREKLAPEDVRKAVEIMTKDYRWPDMGMSTKELGELASALTNPRLVDILDIVYLQHLATAQKPRFGDKTPPYIEIVRELSVLYPRAKFIHLVRDGRDVAISYIELKWHDRGSRYYEYNFDWTRALRFREAYRKSEFDRRILDIKYEDLVSNAEATIRKICVFLEEEFEPDMLNWAERTSRVPEREQVIHPKLSRPLSVGAIGLWRKKLSGFACFIMEACLQRDLRRWGYPLRFSSPAWRPVLVVSGWLLCCGGPLLVRVIPYLKRRNLMPENVPI